MSNPVSSLPEDEFQEFSRRIYADDSVRRACMTLQDKFRCDINIVLLCCWSGASGPGVLDAKFMAFAADHVAPWNDDVVKHLRVTRWVVGHGFDGVDALHSEWLADRIRSVEDDADQVEQLMLSRLVNHHLGDRPCPATDCGPSAVARNLVSYIRHLGIDPNDLVDDVLGRIIAGIFDDLSAASARSLLIWI